MTLTVCPKCNKKYDKRGIKRHMQYCKGKTTPKKSTVKKAPVKKTTVRKAPTKKGKSPTKKTTKKK